MVEASIEILYVKYVFLKQPSCTKKQGISANRADIPCLEVILYGRFNCSFYELVELMDALGLFPLIVISNL
jgi:hypothetical protein